MRMKMNINNGVETSAGILLYRKNVVTGRIEVLLGSSYSNPKKLNKRVWNIPKGHVEKGQGLVETAIRQFEEETGILLDEREKAELDYLGLCCTQKGKHVHIFYLYKDVNGGKQKVNIKSMMIEVEHPRNSGNFITIPQVACGRYFDIDKAKELIFNYQKNILDKLESKVKQI